MRVFREAPSTRVLGAVASVALVGVVGVLGGAPPASAQDCFSFPEAYPLAPGNQWSYATGPGAPSQSLTVQDGFTNIGGVGTRAIRTSTGVTSFETNDASGLRVYRRVGTVRGIPVTATYSPRIARSGATACVGDTQTESGSATVTATGVGTVTLEYSATSEVVARESVTVEAGTFTAYRVEWTTNLRGEVLGDELDETLTEVNWFAPGVGPVQQSVTQEGTTTTLGLRSTNVTPPRSQLSLRFVDGGTPPRAGERFVWAASVSHAGPDAATDAMLIIDPPAGSTIRAANGRDGWSCTNTAVQVRCTNSRLPARVGSTSVFVDTIAPTTGSLATISGSVSSATEDPRPDDNSATLALVLVGGTLAPNQIGGVLVIINDLLGD